MTEYRIKLIWKFSGLDADKIAMHHLEHIEEYIDREKLEIFQIGNERIDDSTTISFIIISKDLLDKIKHDLKPHEGFKVRINLENKNPLN